jgi:hypothetical protein
MVGNRLAHAVEPIGDRLRPTRERVKPPLAAQGPSQRHQLPNGKEITMRKLIFLVTVTLSLVAGAIGTVTVMTVYPEQAIDANGNVTAQLDRATR